MKTQDLAAIFNGLSPSDQVVFFAEIRPNGFFVADEMAYNESLHKQAQEALETFAGIELMYQLNFGTNAIKSGYYSGPVTITAHDNGDVSGVLIPGCFLDSMDNKEAIDWRSVEVFHG